MNPRPKQAAYILGLRYMRENPEGLTAVELASLLRIAKRNAVRYIAMWRAETGENRVVIVAWRDPNGGEGGVIPVYAIAINRYQRDKAKPRALTPAEKMSRYRQKMGPLIRARRRVKRTGAPQHFKI